MSLNPNLWGPDQWIVLYEVCYCIEHCRHLKLAKEMTILKRFLYILSDLFLCDHCGEFYRKQLVLCSEETNFIDWIYDLKNLVTLKIFVTSETTKKCTLQVCPLITLSRLEFYDRLLSRHATLSLKSWYLTINLIRKFHENKKESLEDLEQTLQEMSQTMPYFRSLFPTLELKDDLFFDNYLKSATIS